MDSNHSTPDSTTPTPPNAASPTSDPAMPDPRTPDPTTTGSVPGADPATPADSTRAVPGWTNRLRIRTFLVVVLALSGLTAAAIMTTVAIAAQHTQRASLATQAGELAASKAGDITIALRSGEDAIKLAAADVGSDDPDPCATLLAALPTIGAGPTTIIGPELSVRCSTAADPSIADGARSWLGAAKASTVATVTPSRVPDVISGEPAVQLAVPVTLPARDADGDGSAGGDLDRALVVVPIDPATFSSRRPVPGSPTGSAVTVDDADGVVLGAWPSELVSVGSPDGPSDWSGGRWQVGTSFVPGPDWDVVVGVPASLADDPLVELRTDLLVLLAGFAAITLATLWQVDRWLARPVRAMADLAEHAVKAGRVTTRRAEPGGGLEGVELAHGLNALLDATSKSLDNAHAVMGELTRVREAEKRALAVALHDNAIQALIATEWTLDRLIAQGDADPLLTEARDTLDQAVIGLRRQTFDLMPPAMATTGLAGAVAETVDQLWADHGLAGSLDADLPGRAAPTIEVLAFRTTQEALRNAACHAAARRVDVTMTVDPCCPCGHPAGCLVVRVHDDGRGIDPMLLDARRAEGHIGVLSMRETVQLAGGRFTIGADPSGGTTVQFHLPWQPADDPGAAAQDEHVHDHGDDRRDDPADDRDHGPGDDSVTARTEPDRPDRGTPSGPQAKSSSL